MCRPAAADARIDSVDHDHFHATALLLGLQRHIGAEAGERDGLAIKALAHQELAHRVGTVEAQVVVALEGGALDRIGVGEAGADGVDGDAGAGAFLGEGLGEGEDAGFGGGGGVSSLLKSFIF